MNTTLRETLESLVVGAPQRHGHLTLFPLVAREVRPPGYVPLADALARKLVSITEVSEGGSVPELMLDNPSDAEVLLLDGDELVGARQNRVLNVSILVGAHTRTKIPVSCVERGRWRYTSREFKSEDRMMFARARAAKMKAVSASLRSTGTHRSDQHQVWQEVASKAEFLRAEAPSEAMSDVYRTAGEDLASYRAAFRPVPQQVGAVFAIGRRASGLELFDAPSTFSASLGKLVGSYALDALEERGDASADAAVVQELLRTALGLHVEEVKPVGRGTELRLDGRGLSGSALLDAGRVVHLSVLAS